MFPLHKVCRTLYTADAVEALRAEVRRYKLSAPVDYKYASTELLICVCNGIGAEWMPLWTRRVVSWLLRRIEASATIHDWDYVYLPKTLRNFLYANYRLAHNALKQGALFTGLLAGLACTVFGWPAFRDGKVVTADSNAAAERQ